MLNNYFIFSVRPVKVRLGEVDFDTPDESETQDRNIAELTPHPDYIADQKYNDLALLKLDKPVKFTAFVRPACLHTSKKIAPIAIATGFGKTSFGKYSSVIHILSQSGFL